MILYSENCKNLKSLPVLSNLQKPSIIFHFIQDNPIPKIFYYMIFYLRHLPRKFSLFKSSKIYLIRVTIQSTTYLGQLPIALDLGLA